MGLDMSLYRLDSEVVDLQTRLAKAVEGVDYNSPEYDQASKEFHNSLTDDEKQLVDYYEEEGCSVNTGEDIMYWRKVNAVHAWFVENIQDGVDDCRTTRAITKAELESLKEACEKDTLTPKSGFFFGNTVKNEYYYADMKETVENLTQIINETDFDNEHIVYSSSW
jgi:hypothetical protein